MSKVSRALAFESASKHTHTHMNTHFYSEAVQGTLAFSLKGAREREKSRRKKKRNAMQFTEQEQSKGSVREVRRRGRGQVETEDGAGKMERRRMERGVEQQKEIRTCIYQACQKKANHHGSLATASGQFNLIRSEVSAGHPAEAPSNSGNFE